MSDDRPVSDERRWFAGITALALAAWFANWRFDLQADGEYPVAFVTVGLACVLTGIVIGRIPALVLAVIPIVLAAPFQPAADLYDPVPQWFVVLFGLPLFLVLIGVGVILARVSDARFASSTGWIVALATVVSVPFVLFVT